MKKTRKINLSTLEKVRATDFKRARPFWGNSIKLLVRVDEKDVGTRGTGFYRLPEKSLDSACIPSGDSYIAIHGTTSTYRLQ